MSVPPYPGGSTPMLFIRWITAPTLQLKHGLDKRIQRFTTNSKGDGREKFNRVFLDPFYLNGLKFGSKKFIYIKKGIKYIKNESLKL